MRLLDRLAAGLTTSLRRRLRHAIDTRVAEAVATLQAELGATRAELAAVRGEAGEAHARIEVLESLLLADHDAAPHPAEAANLAFSVILAVRDRPALLTEAVASVLAQTHTRFELLVVDDGSTADIAAALETALRDPRVRLLRQPPLGAYAARNRGLATATGDIIAYLDSDNLWLPGFLADLARAFATDPGLACAYGILVTDAHGPRTRLLWYPFSREVLLRGNFIDLNVFAHRRALYEQLGGFDESLPRLGDWDLALRYSAARRIARIPAWAAVYRVRDTIRISDTVPFAPSEARVRARHAAGGGGPGPSGAA